VKKGSHDEKKGEKGRTIKKTNRNDWGGGIKILKHRKGDKG
jgi:hypothetical protein